MFLSKTLHTQKTKNHMKEHTQEISYETLSACFNLTIHDAAKKLKISPHRLRLLCKKYGLLRWPFGSSKQLQLRRTNSYYTFKVEKPEQVKISSASAKQLLSSCSNAVGVALIQQQQQRQFQSGVIVGSCHPQVPFNSHYYGRSVISDAPIQQQLPSPPSAQTPLPSIRELLFSVSQMNY